MNKILVVGSINVDYVFNVDNMPKIGETIQSDSFAELLGGKGCNQAYYAKVTGSEVSMIACVGNDIKGDHILKYLNNLNINTKGIKITNASTGLAIITVDKNSENTIVLNKGANELVDIDIIDQNESILKWADIILLQNEIPLKTNEYVINKAKELGKYVALNLAPTKKISFDTLKKLDCLIVNEVELEFLGGNEQQLIDKGIKSLLVTYGKKGAKYITKNENVFVQAKKVKAIDTVGAGDSFIGAFFSKLNNNNIKEALEFATNISSIVVQNKGAQIVELQAKNTNNY